MQIVLSQLGDKIDFIDLHNGYAPVIRASGIGLFSRVYPDDEFAECFMGASVYVRDNIEQTKAVIEQFAPHGGKNIELQITEYGPLVYPIVPKRFVQDAAWNRSLCGALYQACLFNVLLAEPRLTSANHLPLCQDVFGALMGIRGTHPQRKTCATSSITSCECTPPCRTERFYRSKLWLLPTQRERWVSCRKCKMCRTSMRVGIARPTDSS